MRVFLNTQCATLGTSATSRYVRALCQGLPSTTPPLDLTYFDYHWHKRPYSSSLPPRFRQKIWPIPARAGRWLFRRFPWLGFVNGRHDLMHLPDDTLADRRHAGRSQSPPLPGHFAYGWTAGPARPFSCRS